MMENTQLKPLLSAFIHRESIDDFLLGDDFLIYREINLDLYDELEKINTVLPPEEKDYYWEPLNFFNLLYDQISITLRYRKKPSDVLAHLRGLGLCELQKYLLFGVLANIRIYEWDSNAELASEDFTVPDPYLNVCNRLFSEMFEYYNRLVFQSDVKYEIRFEDINPILRLLTSTEEKIKYLHQRIRTCRHEMAKSGKCIELESGYAFIKRCELEIEHYASLQSVQQSASKRENKTLAVVDPPFDSLFRDRYKIRQLILELQKKDFLDEAEQWKERPAFITRLYTALLDANMIKGIYSKAALKRIFCERFKVDYVSDRTASKEIPSNDNAYAEFTAIIKAIK